MRGLFAFSPRLGAATGPELGTVTVPAQQRAEAHVAV
jgi:hypothetical protein